MPEIVAIVTAGPDLGARINVGDEVVVGAAPGSGLQLTDPAVSDRHLRIFHNGSELWVEGLAGSGTQLNGERLDQARAFRFGDRLLLGSTLLEVVSADVATSLISSANRPDLGINRRGFLPLLAGAPLLGSLGVIGLSADPAHDSPDRALVERNAAPVPAIDPRHAALLVMDYQPAWIKTIADSDALLSRAALAISTARNHGARVAYTRVAFTRADYAAVPAGNVIFTQLASRPGALDDDAPAMSIDGRVAPEPGDKVVRKTRVGAFARTDLDGWLRALSVDTLILTGISTSGVVLSTVCDAADRDYRIIVVSDACADRDPQIQNVLIHKVFPQRAHIVMVKDLPHLLRHRRSSPSTRKS